MKAARLIERSLSGRADERTTETCFEGAVNQVISADTAGTRP